MSKGDFLLWRALTLCAEGENLTSFELVETESLGDECPETLRADGSSAFWQNEMPHPLSGAVLLPKVFDGRPLGLLGFFRFQDYPEYHRKHQYLLQENARPDGKDSCEIGEEPEMHYRVKPERPSVWQPHA